MELQATQEKKSALINWENEKPVMNTHSGAPSAFCRVPLLRSPSGTAAVREAQGPRQSEAWRRCWRRRCHILQLSIIIYFQNDNTDDLFLILTYFLVFISLLLSRPNSINSLMWKKCISVYSPLIIVWVEHGRQRGTSHSTRVRSLFHVQGSC